MISAMKVDCCKTPVSIDKLHQMVVNGEIVPFEGVIDENLRNFVLTSIFCKVPMDNVYIYPKNGKYHVIDSLVVRVIEDYMNNEFEYVSDINGYPSGKYEDLPIPMKRRLGETQIDLCIFKYGVEEEDFIPYIVQFYKEHAHTVN